MAKLVMGYWDCPVCGNQGIAGTVMNCPSCGRARGDVKFYMKNAAEGTSREEGDRGDIEYLSEEQASQTGKNPDWYCSFCNSLNKDYAARCAVCGASREDSESNYFDQLKKRQEAEAAEKAAQASQSRPAATRQTGKRRPWLLLVILIAVVGLFMFMNGSKTQGNLEVTGVAWSRSVPVEQYQSFEESGWSLPAGAELKKSYNALHHYDQVLDHYEDVEVERSRRVVDHYETYYTYEDNGNGSFSEIPHERPVYGTEYYTETVSQPVYVSVPRYATKYDYTIWRWVHTRDATSGGTGHEAAWPDLNLAKDEREGTPRKELYTFTVNNEKGESATWQLEEADWKNISVGSRISITEKRTGSEAWITDEKGNQLTRILRR